MVAKWKKVTLSVVMVILLGAPGILGGCSIFNQDETAAQPPKIEILKAIDVGSQWHVKQLRIEISGNDKFAILYTLNEGEKVEGYFQVEGDDTPSIGFSIRGASQIFKSGTGSAGVNSDSFSFTASKDQGNTYVITYDNTAAGGGTGKTAAIYTELMYPTTSPMFIPIESQQ